MFLIGLDSDFFVLDGAVLRGYKPELYPAESAVPLIGSSVPPLALVRLPPDCLSYNSLMMAICSFYLARLEGDSMYSTLGSPKSGPPALATVRKFSLISGMALNGELKSSSS
jgi:hypothetical protein